MKIIVHTAAIFFCTAILSCGGSGNEDYVDKDLMKAAAESKAAQKPDSNASIPQPAATQAAMPSGANATLPQPVNQGTGIKTVPATVSAQPTTINAQPVAQQTAATAPGMNPPHGQPGHRCDIPVGSPLNSKPQTTAPAGTLTTTTTPAPASSQPTAPGMNPPHGQPGHRCDIPVGSPLNSKPLTAAPAATISTTPMPAAPPPPGATSSRSLDTIKHE